jgi:hypothetical protein
MKIIDKIKYEFNRYNLFLERDGLLRRPLEKAGFSLLLIIPTLAGISYIVGFIMVMFQEPILTLIFLILTLIFLILYWGFKNCDN